MITLEEFARICRGEIRSFSFRLINQNKEKFECPVCGYKGPFADVNPPTGFRKHAKCPRCGSLERHRIQWLVVQKVLENLNTSQMKVLHFAPEPFFKRLFSKKFAKYESADLGMRGVDHHVDLQNLPFLDATYDFVFASHVLEHIPDDLKALGEIRRILKPNGIAILPVPLVAEKTIEYPEPNPLEEYHVRAPGFDYFERFTPHFSKVDKYASDSLPKKYQLFIYEDRSRWPTVECPLRQAMQGERHIDIVPVCYT
jgi:SAM-dependent methyltransferase